MTIELNPVSVDTKGLVRITGFCRQRLNEFRKDETLGFPEPLVIGRSLRWLVGDVLEWLQAMKGSNRAMVENLASKKIPVNLKPANTKPATWASWRFLASPRLTAAEIEVANHQALSVQLKPGEFRHGAMVQTQEGVRTMRYRVMGRTSGEPAPSPTAIQIRRTITFAPGTPPRFKEGYRAGRAVLPTGGESATPTAKETNSLSLIGIPDTEVSLASLKASYEGGQSLDILCKQYRMGKSRLSKLLRQAGTQMRRAGRPKHQSHH